MSSRQWMCKCIVTCLDGGGGRGSESRRSRVVFTALKLQQQGESRGQSLPGVVWYHMTDRSLSVDDSRRRNRLPLHPLHPLHQNGSAGLSREGDRGGLVGPSSPRSGQSVPPSRMPSRAVPCYGNHRGLEISLLPAHRTLQSTPAFLVAGATSQPSYPTPSTPHLNKDRTFRHTSAPAHAGTHTHAPARAWREREGGSPFNGWSEMDE